MHPQRRQPPRRRTKGAHSLGSQAHRHRIRRRRSVETENRLTDSRPYAFDIAARKPPRAELSSRRPLTGETPEKRHVAALRAWLFDQRMARGYSPRWPLVGWWEVDRRGRTAQRVCGSRGRVCENRLINRHASQLPVLASENRSGQMPGPPGSANQ
jgi:hypothetical protein